MPNIILLVIGAFVLLYLVGAVVTQNLYTEIEINASPEVVWGHLVDFERYPEWNPFIKDISGDVYVGAQIKATIQSAGKAPMEFSPTIRVVEPATELRWLGRLGLPRLFDGEHYWILEEKPDGTVRLIYGEDFRGALALLAFWSIREGTQQGFEAMNAALKELAESS